MFKILFAIALLTFGVYYLPGVTPLFDPFTLFVGSMQTLATAGLLQLTNKYTGIIK